MSETPAEEVNGGEDVQDKKSKKTAKHDGGVADLERVTDYAEEKELSSADISNVNSSQFLTSILPSSHWHFSSFNLFPLLQAINIFGDKRNKETAEKLAKEQELQKIHVKKEDIELIVSTNLNERTRTLDNQATNCNKKIQMDEMLISRQQAEKTLRENRGDVVAALIALTN